MSVVLAGEPIVDLDSLADITPAWDRLAAANGRPQMTPAWVTSWWRHLAPSGTEPRFVVVREGEEIVAVAPFFVEAAGGGRVDYRIPNIQTCAGLSPLAVPGREGEVATTIAAVLSTGMTPRPDLVAFEGVPADSPWPDALRAGWPGRMRPPLRRYTTHPSPAIAMREETFEDWLAGKSSNFRQQMRRARKKFAKAGGSSRKSTAATLAADVETFVRLHAARWQSKPGESNLVAFGDRLAPMLEDVGSEMGADGFRLHLLEMNGEPVAALIFLAAGGRPLYLNCGWDERFAQFKPAMLALLDAVEESFELGDTRIDLGLGRESYKLRFADDDSPVAWTILLTPGSRLPLTAARMAPTLGRAAARNVAKERLSEESLDRLRSVRKRIRR
jgi:CelD/BcsL family acetyltransferase involved in cellulose biosynthesis